MTFSFSLIVVGTENSRESLKLVSKIRFEQMVHDGTRISVWNIPSGKTGLPFQTFRCSGKFSTGTTQKVVYHLLSNRNFRKVVVNGKQPLFQHTASAIQEIFCGTRRGYQAVCSFPRKYGCRRLHQGRLMKSLHNLLFSALKPLKMQRG